jgi:hypothetical protein
MDKTGNKADLSYNKIVMANTKPLPHTPPFFLHAYVELSPHYPRTQYYLGGRFITGFYHNSRGVLPAYVELSPHYPRTQYYLAWGDVSLPVFTTIPGVDSLPGCTTVNPPCISIFVLKTMWRQWCFYLCEVSNMKEIHILTGCVCWCTQRIIHGCEQL